VTEAAETEVTEAAETEVTEATGQDQHGDAEARGSLAVAKLKMSHRYLRTWCVDHHGITGG
jgi:hypothetical protein